MKKIMRCLLSFLFVFSFLPFYAAAEDFPVEITYTVDVFHNAQGGLRRTTAYVDNLDLTLTVDAEKLGLWKNGTLFVYALSNGGSKKITGETVGDLQGISNIEAPRTTRVYELWYEHRFFENALSVLAGLHDYNSEFNVTEYGGLFINSSFGIGAELSGNARPSIFPLAAPGTRIKAAPKENWEFLLGIYDGDPGDPEEDEHFPRSDFDSKGGVFLAAETAYHFYNDPLPGFIKIGIWHNTGEFADVVDVDSGGAAVTRDGNTGGYVVVDKMIYGEGGGQGLAGFLQFGANRRDVNEVNMYIGGGLVYHGLIPGRDEDQLGAAVAHAMINEDIVDAGGRDDDETVIELTYSMIINDHLRIQPDFQYIVNPGAVKDVDNAFVAGARFEVSF
jgi:porin